MKWVLIPLLPLTAIFGVWLFLATQKKKETAPFVTQPVPARIEPAPPVPTLLPARRPTPENPAESWERLLAADGSPTEDRAALEDIVTNFLQSSPHPARPSLGTNDEITRALMDRDALGDSAIPTGHPAIVSGQLVDRWGSPWHFHQLAADVIEVRSAGPDRKLFTGDDLAK